jgi:hypothetical protein
VCMPVGIQPKMELTHPLTTDIPSPVIMFFLYHVYEHYLQTIQ